MTERPIIFSAPMVRALLAGAKSQTRRVLGPGTSLLDGSSWTRGHRAQSWAWDRAWVDPGPSPAGNSGPYLKVPLDSEGTVHRVYPIWWPGMRLWVREAHALDQGRTANRIYYREASEEALARGPRVDIRWRPSIHMPRSASRLTLTVTDVRVERLQDISEADALAEGVEMESADPPFYYVPGIWPHSITAVGIEEPGGRHAARAFANLWSHINGPGAWDTNPWVAAMSFTAERRNIDG